MSQPRQQLEKPAARNLNALQNNLRFAFPLPKSGRFNDLLQAFDATEQK
jgi:hypothetical protein